MGWEAVVRLQLFPPLLQYYAYYRSLGEELRPLRRFAIKRPSRPSTDRRQVGRAPRRALTSRRTKSFSPLRNPGPSAGAPRRARRGARLPAGGPGGGRGLSGQSPPPIRRLAWPRPRSESRRPHDAPDGSCPLSRRLFFVGRPHRRDFLPKFPVARAPPRETHRPLRTPAPPPAGGAEATSAPAPDLCDEQPLPCSCPPADQQVPKDKPPQTR